VDVTANKKKSWNGFIRYRYEQFKKKKPERCNTLTNKIVVDLTDLD
jgi:hypothetical protein